MVCRNELIDNTKNAIQEFYKLISMLTLTKEEQENYNKVIKKFSRRKKDMSRRQLTYGQEKLVKLMAKGLSAREIAIAGNYSGETSVKSMFVSIYDYYEQEYGVKFG